MAARLMLAAPVDEMVAMPRSRPVWERLQAPPSQARNSIRITVRHAFHGSLNGQRHEKASQSCSSQDGYSGVGPHMKIGSQTFLPSARAWAVASGVRGHQNAAQGRRRAPEGAGGETSLCAVWDDSGSILAPPRGRVEGDPVRGLGGLWNVRATGDVGRELRIVLMRSEEHTSELQSQSNLLCRL